MTGCLNKVTLIGHLGGDPDTRATQDGRMIVNLSIATTESWKDKSTGERCDKTEWHKVVIFSQGLAKIASQYLKKGSKLYVEGQLQTRKWTDQQGIDRYTTEIVLTEFNGTLLLLSPLSSNTTKETTGWGNQTTSTPKEGWGKGSEDFKQILDDDVPF